MEEDSREDRKRPSQLHHVNVIRIDEVKVLRPISYDYADFLANLVAASELCEACIQVWELWIAQGMQTTGRSLLKMILQILINYLDHPEGRAFSLHVKKCAPEFLQYHKTLVHLKNRSSRLTDLPPKGLESLKEISGILQQMGRDSQIVIERMETVTRIRTRQKNRDSRKSDQSI
jgi:hypothetical protein